eukprot:5706751-Pleurochrysis_carterae.AAC.1
MWEVAREECTASVRASPAGVSRLATCHSKSPPRRMKGRRGVAHGWDATHAGERVVEESISRLRVPYDEVWVAHRYAWTRFAAHAGNALGAGLYVD